jgi:hypothetical protein
MRDSNGSPDKDQLKNYEYRIVVSGSRGFDDEKVFDENLRKYLRDLGLAGNENKSRVCFISGDAKTGPDSMIQNWCEQNGYTYIRFATKWDEIDMEGAVVKERNGRKYNVLAGFWCNEEMSEVANYLITFYDGVSSGTQDMITRMTDKHNPCRVILVQVEKDEVKHHGGKP